MAPIPGKFQSVKIYGLNSAVFLTVYVFYISILYIHPYLICAGQNLCLFYIKVVWFLPWNFSQTRGFYCVTSYLYPRETPCFLR